MMKTNMMTPKQVIYTAVANGATRQQLVLAACAVARLCLPAIPAEEDRPLIAIETAEKWARGEATLEQVVKAHSDLFNVLCSSSAAVCAVSSTCYATQSGVSYISDHVIYST